MSIKESHWKNQMTTVISKHRWATLTVFLSRKIRQFNCSGVDLKPPAPAVCARRGREVLDPEAGK